MMLEEGCHDVSAELLATVVTHLEMSTPPALGPAPLPDGMVLRRISMPDPDWYRDLFARVGAMDWLWLSRLRMPVEELGAILSDPLVEVRALETGERAEGLLELDFRVEDVCELAFLGLTPTMQGRGAGRAMMNIAIERAFARPVKRLVLHTCTLDSPTALPFYLRSGFRAVRREIELFHDPRLSGLVPEGAAPQHPVIRAE